MNFKLLKHKQLGWILRYLGKSNTRYALDFFSFGLWYFVSALLALWVNVIVNSSLTQVEFGKYSYSRSILELGAALLSLQLYTSYLRFNTKGVSVVLKGLVYKTTIVSSIFLFFISIYITKSLWATPFIFLIVYNERLYLCRSTMDVTSVNKIKMFSVIITLLIVVVLKYSGIFISGYYVLFAIGVGYSVSFFFYTKSYNEIDDTKSLKLKTILVFSMPALALVVVNWLLTVSGQVLIKQAFGYEDVAKFAIAQRNLAVIKLFSSLMLMFYPMVYYREISKRNKKTIESIRLIMSGILIVVALFSITFSKEFYIILGSSQYLDYCLFFRIIVIADVLHTITSFYSTYLGFALKTYITLIICSVGALINLCILFFCLNKYGIIVASYSILISNIVMSVLFYFTAYKGERRYFRTQE